MQMISSFWEDNGEYLDGSGDIREWLYREKWTWERKNKKRIGDVLPILPANTYNLKTTEQSFPRDRKSNPIYKALSELISEHFTFGLARLDSKLNI